MNKQELEALKEGDILYCSWGYDMTINDYCKIIGKTPKCLRCIRISREVKDDNGLGGGNSRAVPEVELGKPFLLRIREYKPTSYNPESSYSIVGSYPYIIREDDEEQNQHKRFGSFSKIDPSKTQYYNTWD